MSYTSTTVGTGHKQMNDALFIVLGEVTVNGGERTCKQRS